MRLLRRLRGYRINLLPVDDKPVVARAEAQGPAQIRKPHEYRTEAATAVCLRPEARDTVRERKTQSLPVIVRVRIVGAGPQAAQHADAAIRDRELEFPAAALNAAIPDSGARECSWMLLTISPSAAANCAAVRR
jgi:hypothetical protein